MKEKYWMFVIWGFSTAIWVILLLNIGKHIQISWH